MDNSGPRHPWHEYADLIRASFGVESANQKGLVVRLADGTRRIEFEGGLTEDHYTYFAPFLDEWDKVLLAKAVLRNRLHPIQEVDWDIAWWALRQGRGCDEEEWLEQLVAERGFGAIADEMKAAVLDYRKTTPRPRLVVEVFEKPRWDSSAGMLFWGQHHWKFRNQQGPVRILLDALEQRQWPRSVQLTSLDPDQVREAARYLRDRTMPYLDWHASSSDGTFSWDAP
jgi:hypothetical protein